MKKSIVFALLFLGLIAIQSRDTTMAKESQRAVPEGEFIDLFIKGKYDITGPATEYINACCKDPDKAIRLLRDNGFEVSIVSEPEEVERLNRHYDQSRRSWPAEDRLDFDKFVSGERWRSAWRFWDIFARYKVSLFIRDGKIERVWARVDRTMP